MAVSPKSEAEDQPRIVMEFYYSHTFPFLTEKYEREIFRRLKTVPDALRQPGLLGGSPG